jgi:predicted transcriptional regulator
MKYLDMALELLRDSQWHSIMSIKKEISLQNEKLNTILFFLQEHEFIEKENEKMRITSLGLRFLELPS